MSDLYHPVTVKLAMAVEDDPRIGNLLSTDARNAKIAIIGFRSDDGVKRNGGRTGAAQAPDRIRQYLYKLTPDPVINGAIETLLQKTIDLGNLRLTGDLAEDQEVLGREVSRLIEMGVIPIIIGGGHETSYGHFLGYIGHKKQVEILNIDSHPDVRKPINNLGHSGSPFRQALEHPSKAVGRYTVAGLNRFSCSASHIEYMLDMGARYFWKEECKSHLIDTLLNDTPGITMVSIDMDSIEQSYAPGVSAPNPSGLHPEFVFEAAEEAGRNKWVKSFDVVEVNPEKDLDGRTSRLAALVIWHFIRGLSQRKD